MMKPMQGETYRLTLPDGRVDEGTLDSNGLARKRHLSAGISGAQPLKTPLGHPSVTRQRQSLVHTSHRRFGTLRQPAEAARSKA